MGFRKIRSIQLSERVFDLVCDELDLQATDYGVKISGYLETFNNCREQGYVLHVDSCDFDDPNMTKGQLYIWAFEHRNGDEIVVSWQENYPNKGMFSEETYNERRKCFGYDGYQKAADFIVGLVEEKFIKEFTKK